MATTPFEDWMTQTGGPMPAADPAQSLPSTPEGAQQTAASILNEIPDTDPTADPQTTQELPHAVDQPEEANKQAPGIIDSLEKSVTYDTVLGWMVSGAMDPSFNPDPNFKLDEAKLQTLGKDIPIEYWGEFNDAQSPAEADWMRQRLIHRIKSEEQLQSLGWSGVGLRLGAQIFDVPSLAVSAVTGSGAASFAAKGSRIAKIIAGGLAGMATDTALQSYIYSQDPLGDPHTILYSGALGSVFGAAGGMFSRESGPMQRLAKEIELKDVRDAGIPLSPKGEKYFADVNTPAHATALQGYLDVIHKAEGTRKNPNSSAVGDFQFIDSTFYDYAKKHGGDMVKGKTKEQILALKRDPSPEAAALRRTLATKFTEDNLEDLADAGIEANGGTLYLSHFLGSGDAIKTLKADPDTPVRGLISQASIDSNPEVFANIKTADDLTKWAKDTYTRRGGSNQTAFSKLRYDMTGILKKDAENAPEWSDIGAHLAEDSVGNADNTPLAPTISHDAAMLRESTLGDFLRTANRAYGNEAQTRGYNWLSRVADRGRAEVMEEAGLVARGVQQTSSKEVTDIANKWREISANLLRQAKSAGVKGFDDIAENEGYVPRIWRSDKIAQAAERFGVPEIKQTISEALAKGLSLELKEATAIINSSWRKIRQRDLGNETQLSMLLDGRNKDSLIKQLEDHGVEKDIIDSIAEKMTSKPDGTSPRARHRLQLDESYASPRTGLKVTDLLENDLERVAINYIQHMSGNIAFAKAGYENRAAFDSVVRKAVDTSVEKGHLSDPQIRRRQKIANTVANTIMGIPNSESSTMGTLGQMLLQYNYVRLGGGFGAASLPEAMEILASNGVRNFIQGMPSLRGVFRTLKDGNNVDDVFIRELESMGVAQDMTLARAFTRYDMWDGLVEPRAATKVGNAAFMALNTGRKVTGIASGLAPLTRVQQLWAGQSIIQNLARGNVKINAKRLALMGLTPSDAKAIQNELQKHAGFQQGMLGRKVKAVNLADFDSEDAADKLRMAVVRYVHRAIQKQDIGEMPEILVSSTTARLLAQFKTFGIVAWSKKTLAGLHLHDTRTALAVGLTGVMGSLVYAGQTYVNSLTKEDPAAYRAKRLSMQNLVLAGVQRSGYSSLVPMAADGASLATTGQPLFNPYARTSELPIDPVAGNPSYQLFFGSFGGQPTGLLNRAAGIPYNLGRDDYEFSKQDLQTIRTLLPWGTMIGANNFYDALGSNLPQRSED